MPRIASQGRGPSLHRAATLALAFALVSGASFAGEPPVSIGEVSATMPTGEFATPLRTALRDALDETNLGRPRERFVLSATLVELDAKKDGPSVRATAVVSLVLRRQKEQTLHALLRGRATAEESGTSLESARESALRAAVESAVRRLPEAVKP